MIRRAGVVLGILLVSSALLAVWWMSRGEDRPGQQVPIVIARFSDAAPIDLPAQPVAAEERSLISDGVVAGIAQVVFPSGVRQGLPARLRWLVTDGVVPDEQAWATASPMDLPDNGSFVLEPGGAESLFLLAEHVDAVARLVKTRLPTEHVEIVMDAAGKVLLRLPGNSERFTVILAPVGSGDAEEQARHGSLHVEGLGDSLAIGGIPLAWSRVHVSVVWTSGARWDVAGAVPLVFREWSVVMIDRRARNAALRGHVRNEAGAAVEGAMVHWHTEDTDADGRKAYQDTESAIDGTFELRGLAAGDAVLVASKSGYVTSRRRVELLPDQTIDVGEIVLGVGATLRGRVLGDPMRSRVALRLASRLSDHAMLSARTTTPDQDGRYEFVGVESGTWIVANVQRQPSLWSPWAGMTIEIGPDATDVVVPDLRPLELASLPLRVHSQAGDTTSGWRVFARGLDAEWAGYAVVDEDGIASLPRGEGRFLVGIGRSAASGKTGPLLAWCGVLDPAAGHMEVPAGRVTLTRSTSLEDRPVAISMEYLGGDWPPDVLPLASETVRVAPGTGDIRIECLRPGSYAVVVQRGREERRVPVQIGPGDVDVRAMWPF